MAKSENVFKNFYSSDLSENSEINRQPNRNKYIKQAKTLKTRNIFVFNLQQMCADRVVNLYMSSWMGSFPTTALIKHSKQEILV